MGRAALAARAARTKNRQGMLADLFERIEALIDASDRDLEEIERTLTDGYAEALSLEAEQYRIQKRITEVAHTLRGGDADTARELAALAGRLDGTAGELLQLRGRLGALRRHADAVRV
jgi:predicted  nucleic acid-binding Zn-ribbon protein